MTDPNHRWDTCACGNPKTAVSQTCRACHMERLHRRRKAQRRAKELMDAWLSGAILYLGPGEGMSRRQFAAALVEVVRQ